MAVGARLTIRKSRTLGTSERPRTYHLAREVGEVRAPVARFAIAIENALRRNDAEKGGEAEWRKLSLLEGFEPRAGQFGPAPRSGAGTAAPQPQPAQGAAEVRLRPKRTPLKTFTRGRARRIGRARGDARGTIAVAVFLRDRVGPRAGNRTRYLTVRDARVSEVFACIERELFRE